MNVRINFSSFILHVYFNLINLNCFTRVNIIVRDRPSLFVSQLLNARSRQMISAFTVYQTPIPALYVMFKRSGRYGKIELNRNIIEPTCQSMDVGTEIY